MNKDTPKIYKLLSNFKPKIFSSTNLIKQTSNQDTTATINNNGVLIWDKSNCGLGLQF
jgi:hypothetical protein